MPHEHDLTPRRLFGLLNIHKPPGVTSRDVVNRVQRLVRPVKCGHAGTLDPMATGVLLIGVGPATRLISMLQEGTKCYVSEFILGQVSDTDDNTGRIEQRPLPETVPTREKIADVLDAMIGTVCQIPPAFSAVHVNGQRAYSLARRGEEVSLAAKVVSIQSIEILNYEWPRLDVQVECGSGTYIRSIARDLGVQLGCGGLMSRLVRTRVGSFQIGDAIDADRLTRKNIADHLCSPIRIVEQLPMFDCTPENVTSLLCGRTLFCEPGRLRGAAAIGADSRIALTSHQFTELLALGELTADGRIQPRTVFIS